jgi:protein KRI1
MPPLLSSSSSESDSEEETTLKINESYAKRLEHNKKREELHRLQEKYGKNIKVNEEDQDEDDEESESESETEDEVGELITPKLDAEIWRTLAMIRERRPEVYSTEWKGYTEDDEGAVEKEKKEKVRHQRTQLT